MLQFDPNTLEENQDSSLPYICHVYVAMNKDGTATLKLYDSAGNGVGSLTSAEVVKSWLEVGINLIRCGGMLNGACY